MKIFDADPQRNARLPSPEYRDVVANFLSSVAARAGNVISLYWWSYRIGNDEFIACDVYGSNADVSMTITLIGETTFPPYPDGEPFYLVDGTDAMCLLSKLVECFQLHSVTSTPQGLLFKPKAKE